MFESENAVFLIAPIVGLGDSEIEHSARLAKLGELCLQAFTRLSRFPPAAIRGVCAHGSAKRARVRAGRLTGRLFSDVFLEEREKDRDRRKTD